MTSSCGECILSFTCVSVLVLSMLPSKFTRTSFLLSPATRLWVRGSFARRARGFVFYFRDMGEGDCVLSFALSCFSNGDFCFQGSMTIPRMPEQKVSAILSHAH